MNDFYPMEIQTTFRIDDAIKDHQKVFFILSQGTLDKSFLWENNRIAVKYYSEKFSLPNKEDDRSFINHTKLFLITYDGIFKILSNELQDKYHVSGDYEIIKTHYGTDFEINHPTALVYLPQTNQMFFWDGKGLDRNLFTSHAYVMLIPIAKKS